MKYDKTANILIIDDDEGVVHTMSRLVQDLELGVDSAHNLKDGLEKLEQYDFRVVLLDVHLPDGNGLQAIDGILDKPFPPQIIILTAYSDPDGAELAIESGAWDYIQKPVSLRDLKLCIIRALQYQEQKQKAASSVNFEADNIVGTSPAISQCMSYASQIARSDANVLITGETGTGKELFAKAIHNNSARRNGNFTVVDCSILTETFIESVLFGHEKGAFTGADRKRSGLVALANGGTLFLDEVGELPESIQSSFLRVLQEKKFRPLGSEKEVYSDFRVICATNKNLDQMVSENLFRPDLLYRLKPFTLELPPLRKRIEDVSLIAASQFKLSCAQHTAKLEEMSPDFIESLEAYDWPGNIRELVNTIENSVASSQSEKILFSFHLPQRIRAQIKRASIKKKDPESSSLPSECKISPVKAEPIKYKDLIEKVEREYLKSLYSQMNGEIKTIIKASGLSRAVLYRKLKKHHIQ